MSNNLILHWVLNQLTVGTLLFYIRYFFHRGISTYSDTAGTGSGVSVWTRFYCALSVVKGLWSRPLISSTKEHACTSPGPLCSECRLDVVTWRQSEIDLRASVCMCVVHIIYGKDFPNRPVDCLKCILTNRHKAEARKDVCTCKILKVTETWFLTCIYQSGDRIQQQLCKSNSLVASWLIFSHIPLARCFEADQTGPRCDNIVRPRLRHAWHLLSLTTYLFIISAYQSTGKLPRSRNLF